MVTKFLVIAMKAVIISLDLGNSRQRGWSSLENTAYLTSEKQEKAFEVNRMWIDFVWKYSILRKLRFFILSLFCCLEWQNGTGIPMSCRPYAFVVAGKRQNSAGGQIEMSWDFRGNRKKTKKAYCSLFLSYPPFVKYRFINFVPNQHPVKQTKALPRQRTQRLMVHSIGLSSSHWIFR